ncbi:MAG TPA: hypothetical protein VHH33_04170 [Nitrososphaeraceae archaeon]|nr:hypothetical protein [Nitrososphaeraceae archaeon]
MSFNLLVYAAAGCTLIAGILHLSLASNVIVNNLPVGIFFVVAGIAQVFWTLPIVRSWGKVWTYVGIGGTIILIIMWIITRFPDNPIIGRDLPVNSMGIAIEAFQVAYIVLSALIIITRDRKTG